MIPHQSKISKYFKSGVKEWSVQLYLKTSCSIIYVRSDMLKNVWRWLYNWVYVLINEIDYSYKLSSQWWNYHPRLLRT